MSLSLLVRFICTVNKVLGPSLYIKKQRDRTLFRVRVGFVSRLTNKRRLAVIPWIRGKGSRGGCMTRSAGTFKEAAG